MIYCDLVGVLIQQTGRHGFARMPWTPTGRRLWDYIRHEKPVLVSECRLEGYESIYSQLREWVDTNINKDVKLYCMQDGVPKSVACQGGDILIDDNHKCREPWQKAGGVFIHFISADQTIQTLIEMRK